MHVSADKRREIEDARDATKSGMEHLKGECSIVNMRRGAIGFCGMMRYTKDTTS